MGEFDAWKKVIVEYERFAIETENLFFQKTCVKMWMKYESAMGDTEAYNKLCVYYANLHSMQVKEQIKRLGDTIDLKLQLQETEYLKYIIGRIDIVYRTLNQLFHMISDHILISHLP